MAAGESFREAAPGAVDRAFTNGPGVWAGVVGAPSVRAAAKSSSLRSPLAFVNGSATIDSPRGSGRNTGRSEERPRQWMATAAEQSTATMAAAAKRQCLARLSPTVACTAAMADCGEEDVAATDLGVARSPCADGEAAFA